MTRRAAALLSLLVLLVFVSYAPVRSAGFIWDDDQYVTENATLKDGDGLLAIWLQPGATPQYYPLVFTSFWLENHLWGLNPLGYHLVNVSLHALNALCLWRVLLLLGVPGAWYAAALFGLHPVHVESVAWITERKNVLSGTFYFLSLLAYLRFRPLQPGPQRLHVWYALALVLFLCALLSKTVTCSLPAVLVLLLWWQHGRVTRQDALYLTPFFALGLALALVTVQLEKHHVGALGPAWNFTPVDRCLIAGRALCFYAGKLLWPTELTFIYPRWHIDEHVWWQYLFPAAVLGVIALLWLLRRPLGRGPLVAVLIFAGTLVPALGFFNVYPMLFSFVADHFQYLASAALLSLFAAGAVTAVARVPRVGLLLVAPLVVLGTLTYLQCQVYRDAETVWTDTLAKNPECWVAHHNLATIYLKTRHYPEAAEHTAQTLRLYPEQPLAHANLVTLALLLDQQGQVDAAVRAVDLALVYNTNNSDAHLLRGHFHEKAGDLNAAEREYLESLRVKPAQAQACYSLGRLLLEQGRAGEAERYLSQAVDLDPNNPTFRAALASARARPLSK
jgi:tetratricopeptide (TPR) repeat protein